LGSGYKNFATGAVLTEADLDGYLMRQTMMTFADASARNTALSGVLDEGMVCYLEDSNRITYYDGANWIVAVGRMGWRLRRAAVQSVSTATQTTVTWDTEDQDTDAFITASSTTVTIPSGCGGVYGLSATSVWASASTGTLSGVEILLSGAVIASGQGQAFTGFFTTNVVYPLSATDTLTVRVYQNSGGSLNIDETFFTGFRISP
jgi:hypothetical protein